MIASIFWPPPRDVVGAVKIGAVLLGVVLLFRACAGGELNCSPRDTDGLGGLVLFGIFALIGFLAWRGREDRARKRREAIARLRPRERVPPPGPHADEDDDAAFHGVE